MDKIELGNTGLMISRLGLGTVKFGRNQGVKYPQDFDLPDEPSLADLLALARQNGINFLEPAPAYGCAEERLGRLLKGQRKDWIICAKAGEEFQDGHSIYNFEPDYIEQSVLRSLKRLQTDYLDILLLHSDGNDLAILENEALLSKLRDLKARGIIRAAGASTKTASGGLKTITELDVVMATYTADYTDEKPVLDYAATHKKGVILKNILTSCHNTDIAQDLRFEFGHRGTSAAIIGTINPAHLLQNIHLFNQIS